MTDDASRAAAQDENAATSADKAEEPRDDLVVTRHEIDIDGAALRYTVTAGRIVLRKEQVADDAFSGSKATAEVFVVAYTLDDADPASRPVTFAFNGGPGSSSVWLHLGLLGPRRVLMGDAGELAPPPYGLGDNPQTLLRHSDLVFIDPVSTGFSRAVSGGKPGEFHGFTGDIESVGEVIRLWTTRGDRWMSPKFIVGESYGTVRAVAVAERLQETHALTLNGLVLVSSVLDFGTQDFGQHRWDESCLNFLPTYTAIAHYHGKVKRRSLRALVKEAEEYAAGDYPAVLRKGNRLTTKERAAAVRKLASLTGLSEDYVDRADLRIEHWRFFGELLRDERRTVGRLDGRFSGPMASAIAENMDADPAHDAISGPYAAVFNHYVREELGFESDLPYEQISRRVDPWSYKDFEGRPIDVTPKLERAMRQNPHLRVHVAYGYYDGATPHFAAEDVVAHLNLPDELRANIEHAYYEAGHMMYVHEPTRRQQSRDLAAFVTRG